MDYRGNIFKAVMYASRFGNLTRLGVKYIRTERAEKRQALQAERSPSEQLALLDRRLGEGVGAVRERARLKASLRKYREAVKEGAAHSRR